MPNRAASGHGSPRVTVMEKTGPAGSCVNAMSPLWLVSVQTAPMRPASHARAGSGQRLNKIGNTMRIIHGEMARGTGFSTPQPTTG